MGNKTVVLVVDDEAAIRKLLRAGMPDELEMLEAETAREGLRLTATNNPRVIILDLGLQDMDGIELIRKIREFSQVPIIVLSAREQEGDKVAALDCGANDYLTKPFSVAELHARIRVALRANQPQTASPKYEFGSLVINIETREVLRDHEPVHLTPIEFKLLVYLVQNVDKVLTHKQILSEVWGAAYLKETQYLRVFMGQLRHKLEVDPAQPRHLITETGVGYRFRSGE